MPTFSISGVLVTRDGTDTNIAASPVTLDLVVPEGQTTFTYSILETFPDDLPEVEISASDVAVDLSGAGVPDGIDVTSDDGATFLGAVSRPGGAFVVLVIEVPRPGGGSFDAIFPIGGAVPPIPTNLAEFNALDGSITGAGAATGAFAPGATIDFGTLANTTFDASPTVVQGTDGDDVLNGTAVDDFIVTGNATPFGDFVTASTGNDTIDMSDNDGQNGFVSLNYRGLAGPISATIDGGANTGSVDKGAAGTDTLLGVQQPLLAGWTNGGLDIRGTSGNDNFNLTPQGEQWMAVRGGDGVDSYSINGTGLVRMDFRDATQGIEIDLGTRQIADDGFGNAETIGGTNAVWEVYGSAGDDMFTGSGVDESYRYFGGNNTLDGGAGFDRLRYDTGTVASVNIDASAGTATGALNGGGTFTDTISGFERLRGSDGNDQITGSTSADRLEGRGGNDTIAGGQGNDFIQLGGGADTYVYSGGIDVLVDFEIGTDSIVIDIPGVTQADVDAAFANPQVFEGATFVDFGVPNQNLNFGSMSVEDVQSINATAAPSGPITSLFLKIDPTQAEEVFSIEALGLNPGDLFTIQLVGDFQAGIDFADNSQNGETFYDGVSFFSSDQTKANVEFSGTNMVRFQNNDFPIDDNSDPDNDYGLVIEKREPNLTGTEADDDLASGGSSDLLQGFGGNDTISGLSGNDTLLGGDGDDNLFGGDGDDLINPGENVGGATGFDFIETGFGNDTVDMGDIVDGYVGIDYGFLSGTGNTIAATINGAANTGMVNKGAAGNDTFLDVVNPMTSPLGGLSIRGSDADDTFNVHTVVGQFLSLRGNGGSDTFNITGTGVTRLDYSSGFGITADLVAGTVAHNSGTDTINGTARQLRATDGNDSVMGGAADETFILRGGTDTVDGGAGTDALRYDRTGMDGPVTVDFSTGQATGSFGGSAFVHNFSNIEHIRGSQFDDTIIGTAGAQIFNGNAGDDTLTGGGGADIFRLGHGSLAIPGENGGTDTITDFQIGVDKLDLDAIAANSAEIAAAFAAATDTADGALVSFSDGSAVIFENLNAADVTSVAVLTDVSIPGQTLSGSGSSEGVIGSTGDDTIAAGAGNDTIDGGDGDDVINTGLGFDFVEAGGGNDLVQGLNGFDTLNGGAGSDTLQGNFGNDELGGGDGDDELQGGVGFDVLRGDAGDDMLVGRDGFDTLEGGTGQDMLQGNAGNDSLSGGDDDDLLIGGIGSDVMGGDAGDDLLQGQGGFDTLDGGDGADTLQGNNSDDLLNGGAGDDRLEGGFANDVLNGDAGNDTLEGGNGFDLLNGGDGDDRLEGNAGNDTLDGGAGDDVLRGGLGADTFVFRVGSGNDRIVDLGIVDSVELEAALLGGGSPDPVDLRDISTLDADGFLLLDFGGGDTLTFTGITNTNAILDDVSFI